MTRVNEPPNSDGHAVADHVRRRRLADHQAFAFQNHQSCHESVNSGILLPKICSTQVKPARAARSTPIPRERNVSEANHNPSTPVAVKSGRKIETRAGV